MMSTMLVVRLSSTALKKNVKIAILHNRRRLLVVLSASRTKLNPPFWSTTSTIVIAPIKKNNVVEVSPRLLSRARLAAASAFSVLGKYNSGDIITSVQQATNMKSATAALFTLVTFSSAISAYPITNTATIAIVNIIDYRKRLLFKDGTHQLRLLTLEKRNVGEGMIGILLTKLQQLQSHKILVAGDADVKFDIAYGLRR